MTNTNYKNACSILDDMTDEQLASAAQYFLGRLYDHISENDIDYLKQIVAHDPLPRSAP